MDNRPDIEKFIDNYLKTLDSAQRMSFTRPKLDIWSFSDQKDVSEKLIKLVLGGKKRATAGIFNVEDDDRSVGDWGVIIDHTDSPRCLIEYTEVEIKPFNKVDLAFAKEEGEGFKTINDWRKEHRRVFGQWQSGDFLDKSLVVCSRFKLLFPSKH